MQISIDYTVALNILITCSLFETEKVTANFIVQKTGGDGTTVREVMYKLKNAGMITNKPGPGGTKLIKELKDISLYDVYEAIFDTNEGMLKFYESDDIDFTRAVNESYDTQFKLYKELVFKEMKKTSVAKLCNDIKKRL